jgi:alpha-L-fucosidase
MGRVERIAGFTYLPRQDRVRDGIVQTYRFETSVDGTNWTTDVDSGHFDNVRNNPMVQEVPFAPVNARFFRFTALQSPNGQASAAEISVLPAGDKIP